MTLISIATILVIIVLAWGGMRLMQRTTGCACEMPPERTLDE